MLLTVAVCTWNRCALLRQALEHMTLLRIPSCVGWELVVVNNNCSDATDSVLGEFQSRLPLKVNFEPQAGHSHARNRAISEARGDYIIWTDDDVLVDEGWLSAYVEAFSQQPHSVFFGGPVLPCFASLPPEWLTQSWPIIADRYGICDWGPAPFAIKDPRRIPIGANFAVRTEQQRTHLYDPNLGHRQSLRIANEETALLSNLLSCGYEGWWVPHATVQHHIGFDRMTVAYLRRSYCDPARYAFEHSHKIGAAPGILRLPYQAVRYSVRLFKAFAKEVRYRCTRIVAPPAVWVRDLKKASIAWGRFLSRF